MTDSIRWRVTGFDRWKDQFRVVQDWVVDPKLHGPMPLLWVRESGIAVFGDYSVPNRVLCPLGDGPARFLIKIEKESLP